MPRRKPGVLEFVENDLLPWLDVEWESQDITGYTINLHVRQPTGLRFTRVAVIDDANVGGLGTARFHFEWQPGDLIKGNSEAEIEIIDPSARPETFKGLVLKVEEEIG